MNKSLFLLLCIFSFSFAYSQEKEYVQEVVIDSVITKKSSRDWIPTDSLLKTNYITDNPIFEKKFSDSLQKKYKGEDFNYTENVAKESFLDKLERKIEKLLKSLFGNLDKDKANTYSENIIRFIAIVIFGLALYFIIKFILAKNGNLFFSKKNKKLNVNTETFQENIHEISFADKIFDFEKKKNYRMAIRYHFLQVLKTLSDKKMIDWNPEKTNKDYVTEIKDKGTQSKFSQLVKIFDYVWYGEFDINEDNYSFFKKQFESFKV